MDIFPNLLGLIILTPSSGHPSEFGSSLDACVPNPILQESISPMSQPNPCMCCGACCAFYRISFDSSEVDDFPGGMIPLNLTIKLNQKRSAMRGTETRPHRCKALCGKIGQSVHCDIYDRRPSTCREFFSLWEDDMINSLCDRARVTYGLMPLSNY